MSNLETRPDEIDCRSTVHRGDAGAEGTVTVEVLAARDVPLGGPRAMTVHRTLPQRRRSLIGAWCFADHYGPDDVSATGGMDVPPHPHTGLQTVSWLFSGEIEHRDTMGNHAMVRPGELNLMTAGHGIAHTEVSTPDTTILHGVQLWVALPEFAADTPRDFAHHIPSAFHHDDVEIRVFLGELLGERSPVHTFTPLLGAELRLPPGAQIELPVTTAHEHGLLVDAGVIRVVNSAAEPLQPTELGYIGLGATAICLRNESDEPARVILLGGAPLDEQIIMWWNFLGRSHEDIVAFRQQWTEHSERFGQVEGYSGDVQHLPAPTLPNSRLSPRHNIPGQA
ncbi:pirin family protein [Gordonia tangerina]|uniref:Pirin family protein n=1 Tax=Gordonia tangerina TaxID=2911060 RepID=A0ABS9DNM6_9ACTN|nr:pirin family protein [Gordonia tangerina]MCF3940812.1 pirin family protein [Gordonia tangerina]